MMVRLELKPETEERLRTEARRTGLSPNQFVETVLEEKLAGRNGADKPRVAPHVFDQALLADGFLVSLPEEIEDEEDFVPVEFSGKPISETIIEERR